MRFPIDMPLRLALVGPTHLWLVSFHSLPPTWHGELPHPSEAELENIWFCSYRRSPLKAHDSFRYPARRRREASDLCGQITKIVKEPHHQESTKIATLPSTCSQDKAAAPKIAPDATDASFTVAGRFRKPLDLDLIHQLAARIAFEDSGDNRALSAVSVAHVLRFMASPPCSCIHNPRFGPWPADHWVEQASPNHVCRCRPRRAGIIYRVQCRSWPASGELWDTSWSLFSGRGSAVPKSEITNIPP